MKEYLRASEAAELLCVTTQTVRKYHRTGKIIGYTTPGGQTIYKTSELYALLNQGHPNTADARPETTAYYLRASDGNKDRLHAQEQQLTDQYGTADYIITDKASGLNEKRKGLKRLINLAKEGKITRVIVTQKDRLTRFGYTYLEELFAAYDVEVIAAFDKQDKTLTEELMNDFMSLIASFAGKFYRLRGYEQQKELLAAAEQNIADKEKQN